MPAASLPISKGEISADYIFLLLKISSTTCNFARVMGMNTCYPQADIFSVSREASFIWLSSGMKFFQLDGNCNSMRVD